MRPTQTQMIATTRRICGEFDARTEPWATSDLAEAVECATNCDLVNLPGLAFDRWIKCLDTRDAADLNYDSPARHNARCDALGVPQYKFPEEA